MFLVRYGLRHVVGVGWGCADHWKVLELCGGGCPDEVSARGVTESGLCVNEW